jgi:Lon protease-like protein
MHADVLVIFVPGTGVFLLEEMLMPFELPLFPLNVVLFPGADLPLHIFEPRYRQMVNECYEQQKPFGVVLAQPESEPMLEAPCPIGTMAEIETLARLEDGRMNLIARGGQRFRIVGQHRKKTYLTGLVEIYDDQREPESLLHDQGDKARELFTTYLNILLEVVGKEEIQFDLPESPGELSHFIAYFLDLENVQKQALLELDSTVERLRSEIELLRREVPFMRQMLSMSTLYRAGNPDRSKLN